MSYYFQLRTFTPAHEGQSNNLWSDFSDPLGFTFNPIQPESGGTLVITDTSSTVTEVAVPPGAVEETVTLGLSSLETVTTTANLVFASQAFELDAYQNGTLQQDFAFVQPVTVTIEYTDADVAGIGEDSLTLLYWDGASGQWVDAASTCTPPSAYDRHPETNWLAVPICHLSQFALFGNQQHSLFVPLVRR
jgi:hypothetical protein